MKEDIAYWIVGLKIIKLEDNIDDLINELKPIKFNLVKRYRIKQDIDKYKFCLSQLKELSE